MNKTIVTLAAALGLALGANAAAGAVTGQSVVQPAGTGTFSTTLSPLDRGAGAYTGTLHLTISPDGIVQGWFRDQNTGRLQTVAGGVTGDKIWFDIGSRGDMHIDGTYRNGVIVGYTYLDQDYEFEAVPSAS